MRMKTPMKWFIAAILAVGAIRFALTVAGLQDSVVRFASMTAVIAAGTVYFAIASTRRKERLKDAYLLIAPYMTVEVLALSFTWMTGRQTIFHAAEYSFGTDIVSHTIGHLVGGLTWEPLMVFLLMEAIRGVYAAGRWVLARGRG